MFSPPFCMMYHFVADPASTPFPRLVSRRTGEFARQLDDLCARYEPITLDQVRRFAYDGADLPRRGFLLTFDHATRDHLENVLPALQSRGLQGTFFVYTQVPEEGRLCPVDKQRFLEYAFEDYLDLLRRFAEHIVRLDGGISAADVRPSPENLARTRSYLAQFPFYGDGERFFRHLRDNVLPPDLFKRAISALFEDVLGSEADFARRHYLAWPDLGVLRDAGMELGGHGHRHLPMSRTPGDEQAADVATCVRLLRDRLGVPADAFAYPNGDYNADTPAALREAGVTLGFTTDAGGGISRERPLEIGRVDTAVLPLGADEDPERRPA